MSLLLQSIVLIKDVAFTPLPPCQELERGAELIYKMGGCIRPPIVKRDEKNPFKYILISGQFAMSCARHAYDIYGMDAINVFIVNDNNTEEELAQALSLFS